MSKPLVGIIMGSNSDLTIMKEAAEVLDELEVGYELTIVSAHRTPLRMFDYASTARSRGLKVIIAGAGGAAHLPGMVASMTSGVPVATVALDGARNAGILAAQILGTFDKSVGKKLDKLKGSLKRKVESAAKLIESKGWKSTS